MAATTTYYGLFAKPNLDDSQTLYGKLAPEATALTVIAKTSIREFLNSSSGSTETTVDFQQYNASFSKESFYLHFINDDQQLEPAVVNSREIGRINLFKGGGLKSLGAIKAKLSPPAENELAELDPYLNSQAAFVSRPPTDQELEEQGVFFTDRRETPSPAQPSNPPRHQRSGSLSSRGRQAEPSEHQGRSSSVGAKPQPDVSTLFEDAEGGNNEFESLLERAGPPKGYQPSIKDLGKGLDNLPKEDDKSATPLSDVAPEESDTPQEPATHPEGRIVLSYTLFGLAGVALIGGTLLLGRAAYINRAAIQAWTSPAA